MNDTLSTNDGWMFNFTENEESDELTEDIINELAEENQDGD